MDTNLPDFEKNGSDRERLTLQKPATSSRFRSQATLLPWLTMFRVVVAALVAVAMFYIISKTAQQISELNFDVTSIDFRYVLLGIGCYAGSMLLSCCFWKTILNTFDCHPDWEKTLLAFFASQLGKYVPGKAMVVVIRTDMIRDQCSSTKAAAASVIVETLTWIFVGSVFACFMIAWKFNDHTALKWTASLLAIVAGITTFPPVFRLLAAKLTGSEPSVFAKLNLSAVSFGWLLLSIGWCLNALSLHCVVASISEINPGNELCWADFPLMLACVSLATVAGFASLLPGGIGVRELVMIPLLGPRFGIPMAIIAAILIRLVWIATELVASGIIYLTFRFATTSKFEK